MSQPNAESEETLAKAQLAFEAFVSCRVFRLNIVDRAVADRDGARGDLLQTRQYAQQC